MVGEIIWIPVNEIIQPKNNYRVYVDYYWIVKDDKVAVYREGVFLMPQANMSEVAMKHRVQQFLGAHVEFFHVAYLLDWKQNP